MSATMHPSRLQQDLSGGGRDTTYRAMSFIARRGGPRLVGAAGDAANLDAQRAGMLSWLQSQPDPAALANDYLRHCEQWSPIFRD